MQLKPKIKLLISCLSPVKEALALVENDNFELSFQNRPAANEAELADAIRDVDAVFFGIAHYYSADVLKQAKNLKLMSFCGTGYESFVDAKAAKELGIAIANAPGANSESVAELAIGLALDALRKISFTGATGERPVTKELSGLKIGLIGYGEINRRVHKILAGGFGANVRYWNRTAVGGAVGLDTILRESDMIFLAITANDETKNFIGAEEFAKMKDGVIIINPARKTLIDVDAAWAALESGKVGVLAMDGILDADYPLRKFGSGRFIATPHIGARTSEAHRRMETAALQNIVDFFESEAK